MSTLETVAEPGLLSIPSLSIRLKLPIDRLRYRFRTDDRLKPFAVKCGTGRVVRAEDLPEIVAILNSSK